MASDIAIYTLTSKLHDEQAIRQVTEEFLGILEVAYELKGDDYSDYGSHALDLIYVRTGGTEGIFKRMLPELQKKQNGSFRLLTSGKSNSLAASLEILAYLRKHNIHGEIVHGSPEYINKRLTLLEKIGQAKRQLAGCRLGIFGQPSDWQELMDIIEQTPETMPDEHSDAENIRQSLPGANRIYLALKTLLERHHLQGFTLRCFDLLTSMHNTGCLALAKLNSEGYVAGCEGDAPAMVTMMIARALTGVSGFQANPSSIDPETGEILFAHCTIPLNMVESYELDTHFESGIGVGIRGYMKPGPITIFKVSGDMQSYFIAEGELIRNQAKPDLCRTQQVIRLADKNQVKYFLKNPIGNHHIVLAGHHRELLEEILK